MGYNTTDRPLSVNRPHSLAIRFQISGYETNQAGATRVGLCHGGFGHRVPICVFLALNTVLGPRDRIQAFRRNLLITTKAYAIATLSQSDEGVLNLPK